MTTEATKKENGVLIQELAPDIFNNLNSGLIIFGEDKYVNDINQVGLKLINSIYPEINSPEQTRELTLDKIFSETNFPGWVGKFESLEINSDIWLTEYLTANINNQDLIFSVRAGRVKSNADDSLLVVIFNDVTDEKKSQHRLAWLEKRAEKGSMASITVHDLNNYLSLLLGGAEMTEMMLKNGKTDKATEKIVKLKDNVKKTEAFIAGFTDEYKIVTNKQNGNINKLIAGVVSYLSTCERFKKISIITDLDSEIPEFEFDPDQLSMLLLNFLNNSAEAIDESKTKRGIITIKTKFDSDVIHLTIFDTGSGLSTEIKEKLFKRRFTTKENHTGYGLMVCDTIVNNHNGQVEIIDDVSEGAAFRITFPAS